MGVNSKITYLGWSSFVVETENGTLLFDPFYREMCEATWSSLDDFKDANVICVTHGHADHYVDVPDILNATDAVVVGSKEVCRHLNTKYKIKKERLNPIKYLEEISVSGFKITAFEFGHREVSTLRSLKEGFINANLIPVLRFQWLNLLKAPGSTPFQGFFIEGPDNLRLMNYCEGFSDAMKIEEVSKLGRRFKPDILIAGVQLNFEEKVARGVAAISPKSVMLFQPHEALFEKLGLKSSPVETFVEKISELSPEVKIIVAKPHESYTNTSLD